MLVTLPDRLSRLGYVKARRLLIATGLAALVVIVLVTWARRVDTVEVVATLLFIPIFVAFVYRGVVGGVGAALGAIVVYAAMRYPAIEAVGAGDFAGLIAARSAAYLIFGLVGGWSAQVLEGSLEKLELYDEVDDETGLFNARHLLHQTDLEMGRAGRYRTIFSLVLLDLPAGSLAALRARNRRVLLRELGRQLGEGVRSVDHVVHVREGDVHHFAVVLPETAAAGAEVFRARFEDRMRAFLGDRGVEVAVGELVTRSLSFPGDDRELVEVQAAFARIDAGQHR